MVVGRPRRVDGGHLPARGGDRPARGGVHAALLRDGGFDPVLASGHSASAGAGCADIADSFRDRAPARVLRDYLAETAALITGFDAFDVLAHIDYPVRYWPPDAKPHDPDDFEDEYRHVLRTLADAGKALEVNT